MRSFTRGHLDMAMRVGIIAAHVLEELPSYTKPEEIEEEVYKRLWETFDKLAVETFTDRTRVRDAVRMVREMEGLR